MKTFVACALAAAAVGCRAAPPPVAENVVVVTIDTLRADRLGVYGATDVETPHLDALAAAGAVVRHATAQVPLTRPAHLSLFSGLYPFSHGVRENVAPRFEENVPLLAEILRDAGFRTGGFVSSIVLSSESGLDRGFSTFSDDFGESDREALFLDSVQKRGDETTAEALEWLSGAFGERFFLWLHLYDPHDPYDPPEPYASRYPDRPYDGEVAFSDELVGRLITALDEAGVIDDTLIVVAGDHGEAFGEHKETGHGYFVYETTLHVPLVIRGPGIPPGTEVTTPVEGVDLFPTIAELLGVPLVNEPRRAGRSVAGSLRGGRIEPETKPIYSESLMASLRYGWGELFSLREGPWKLIDAPRPELYNLEEDPGERNNRIDTHRGVAERLRARLDELAPDRRQLAADRSELDPELLEKLGALGYLGSGTGTSSPNADPKDKLEEFRFLSATMRDGLTLLQQKQYRQSIERFRAVIDSGSESFEALYHMGRAFFELGEPDEAVPAIEAALAVDRSYSPAYLDLCEAYSALGDDNKALDALRRGQRVAPESARLFEREAELWVFKRRPLEAALAFEAVIDRRPDDALTRVRLGEQYRDLGKIDEALNQLGEAVRLAPEEASYWNSLGMVQGGHARMEEAELSFRKAHDAEPTHAQYAFNLGLALLRLGRADEARVYLEKSLENDPTFAPARSELSRLESR